MANDYKGDTLYRVKNWEFEENLARTRMWISRWINEPESTSYDKNVWGEILTVMSEVLKED